IPANLMTSAPGWALASVTAWANDPGPLSARFVTVNVLGTVRSSRTIRRGTKDRRGGRARVACFRSERHPRVRRKNGSNIGYPSERNGSAIKERALIGRADRAHKPMPAD